MTRRPRKSKTKSRKADAKRRAKSRLVRRPIHRRRSNAFTARLTIDVTPDLRGRIKITAFERGVTVAFMLRSLLLKTFPRTRRSRR